MIICIFHNTKYPPDNIFPQAHKGQNINTGNGIHRCMLENIAVVISQTTQQRYNPVLDVFPKPKNC